MSSIKSITEKLMRYPYVLINHVILQSISVITCEIFSKELQYSKQYKFCWIYLQNDRLIKIQTYGYLALASFG